MRGNLNRQLAALIPAIALGIMLSGCVYDVREPAVTTVHTGSVYDSPTIYVDERHHGATVHEYHYYPDAQVYYDPGAVCWFWFDAGVWRTGRALPRHIHVREHNRVRFRSDASRPYVIHDRVRRDFHDRHGHYEHRGRPDPRRDNDYRPGHDNRHDPGRDNRYDRGRGDRYDHGRGGQSDHGRGDRYDHGRGGHSDRSNPSVHLDRGAGGRSSPGSSGYSGRGPGGHSSPGAGGHSGRGSSGYSDRGPGGHSSPGSSGHSGRGPGGYSSPGRAPQR